MVHLHGKMRDYRLPLLLFRHYSITPFPSVARWYESTSASVEMSFVNIRKYHKEMVFGFIVTCLFGLTGISAHDFFEGCNNENKYGYEYTTFNPVAMLKSGNDFNTTGTLRFDFYVRAKSNAHILLSTHDNIEGIVSEGMAYEIVIGGGKNTFSQMRLYRQGTKATEATRSTNSIVSATEFRQFWIEIRRNGIITVGRAGDDDPFVFWVNTQPFAVSYFAFSTWNNVKGEFYFNCEDKSKYDPENMGGEGNVTAMYRLKTDLLSFYNPTVIPHRDGYPEETVEVYLEANYFHLDEKRSELTLNGMAIVKWTDWKLSWDPISYDDIKYMHVNPFRIWTPSFRVLNSLALHKSELLSLSGNLYVTSNGEIILRVPFHSVTVCMLGYYNWPFDMHNCTLLFGFATEPLKINVRSMRVSRLDTSEWEIRNVNGSDMEVSHVGSQVGFVNIHFRRRDPSYEFILLPPYLGAAIMCLVSFWLQPNTSPKLFLNCGSIIVLIAVLLSLCGRTIPMVSSTPKIISVYSWSIGAVLGPIVLYVVLQYLPAYIHFPRGVSNFLNGTFVEVVFWLPKNAESQSDYSHLRESVETSISAVRLITLIDRFVFYIYFVTVTFAFVCLLAKFEMFNF